MENGGNTMETDTAAASVDDGFEVLVYEVKIVPHENADAIEIALIEGYQSIVQKDTLHDGDLVAYIPEGSIVPDDLLAEMGLTGRLAGSQKNHVKAIRLRGVMSQGLVYPMPHSLVGTDVKDELGITKYHPALPAHLRGERWYAGQRTLSYHIDNLKKHPNVFQNKEMVWVTEKLHGTWACFGWYPEATEEGGQYIVASKGLSGRGQALRVGEGENESNLYVQTFRAHQAQLDRMIEDLGTQPFYVLGEIFGRGVQDLDYGQQVPNFRVFDIYLGLPEFGHYADPRTAVAMTHTYGFTSVPRLYLGEYYPEIISKLTTGQTTLDGEHIREGIVIKPERERYERGIGRVIVKSLNEDYLLRKGEVTEYE